MWLTVFGEADTTVLYIFAFIAGLNVILALAVLIVGCCYRSPTPGSSMDVNIALGGIALGGSVLLSGVQISWLPQDILLAICQFHPALVTFGLLWFIGGLLMKVSATFHFYRRHDGKNVSRYEYLPHLWLFFVMLVDVVIVLVWIFRYRPILVGHPETSDLWVCAGPEDPKFQLTVSVVHGTLLLFAAIIVWAAVHLARSTPSSYETSLMSVVIYNTVFVVVAASVVYVFGESWFSRNMMYPIIGGLVNYAVFAAFLFLLIGKVVTARRVQSSGEDVYDQVDHDKGATNRSSTGSGYLTSPSSGLHASPQEDNFPY